jgi:hypothetical protein
MIVCTRRMSVATDADENDLRQAQTLLDLCERCGMELYLWRGEIHITGTRPAKQRLAEIRKHELQIRQLLGDDGMSHPWAVSQLPGGTLLYMHPRFDAGDSARPVIEEPPASVMPFGKYRGAPLDALVEDVSYAEWLIGQRWFYEKYPCHRRHLAAALRRTRDDAEGQGPSAA